MKTRDSVDKITQLPPAPAPTARDANRWPMPARRKDGSPARRARSLFASAPPAGATRAGRRRSFMQGAAGPLMVALFMGAFALLRGFRGGGLKDYRGPLIALAVIVFLVISRVGRRRATRHQERDDQTGR